MLLLLEADVDAVARLVLAQAEVDAAAVTAAAHERPRAKGKEGGAAGRTVQIQVVLAKASALADALHRAAARSHHL